MYHPVKIIVHGKTSKLCFLKQKENKTNFQKKKKQIVKLFAISSENCSEIIKKIVINLFKIWQKVFVHNKLKREFELNVGQKYS